VAQVARGTTKTKTGDAGGTKSTVDTVYDSCG
jgi:hypothetical protein